MSEPRIVSTPGTCGGDPRVDGTRLPVHTIIEWYLAGDTEEQIRAQLPTLPVGGLAACVAYYDHHTAEIDQLRLEHGDCCEARSALRELLAALRECRFHASTPISLWTDGKPADAWPNEQRLVAALTRAEAALSEG